MPKVMKAGTGFIVKHAGEWFRVPKKLVRNGDHLAARHLDDVVANKAAQDAARRAAGKKARKESKRDLFMGRTPGQGSPVGSKVERRMRANGDIRGRGSRAQVRTGTDPEVWTPLRDCDMGHQTSAVDF